MFARLLSISKPREQAIYLLCGCAGTRIGQALSLTRDDYNYETREVFIVDPLSDETGPSGTLGRHRLLSQKYQINMEKTPYKYLACKYPIPLQYTELLWVDESFKYNFLKVLTKVNKGSPSINGHPFIFQTKSGKILTPNEAYRTFRSKVEKLIKIVNDEWQIEKQSLPITSHPDLRERYSYLLRQLKKVKGPHSLRHMYAIIWADYAAIHPDLNINELELLCQFGMGQKSRSSVQQYFTLRQQSRKILINKLLNTSQSPTDNIQSKISQIKKHYERKI